MGRRGPARPASAQHPVERRGQARRSRGRLGAPDHPRDVLGAGAPRAEVQGGAARPQAAVSRGPSRESAALVLHARDRTHQRRRRRRVDAQAGDRSVGRETSVTLRGGTEVEVIPNRLQLRAGSYMEPTRFRESTARLHATTGFELRTIDWSVFGIFPEDNAFRVSGAVDVSREYFGWSLGGGIMRLRLPREVRDPAMETGLVCAHRRSRTFRPRSRDFPERTPFARRHRGCTKGLRRAGSHESVE